MNVLTTSQSGLWHDRLESLAHDIYHRPEYHQLMEDDDTKAYLFHYEDGPYQIALPLLLRTIDAEQEPDGWHDATSVYGYAGPIASHASIPETVLEQFRVQLRQVLLRYDVISVFSRLHPFGNQQAMLRGLGECEAIGKTVSIDLSLPPEQQWAAYRNNHQRDIKRLKRLGAVVIEDRDLHYFEEFVRMYDETMRRDGASSYYFFGSLFFSELLTQPELNNHLFVCLVDQDPICAGIFSSCGNIVQYHYSGTCERGCRLSPLKLLIDEVRRWAHARGFSQFHLGGGVGAREDSLFAFKLGFSKRCHPFVVWRWITQPEVYETLCEERWKEREQHGEAESKADYFPAYRAPA